MAAVTICSDFGAQENKVCHCFHCFPIFLLYAEYIMHMQSTTKRCTPHLFAMKWWDWMPWSWYFECWVLSQLFSLSSFTFIKRLFNSSLLSAIRVVSSACLRLIFLPAILTPACASSSWAFRMMYSAYKLYKQGDKIEPGSLLFQFGTSLFFHIWF